MWLTFMHTKLKHPVYILSCLFFIDLMKVNCIYASVNDYLGQFLPFLTTEIVRGYLR